MSKDSFQNIRKFSIYSRFGIRTLDPVYLSVFLNTQIDRAQVRKHQRGSSGQFELYSRDIARLEIWKAPTSGWITQLARRYNERGREAVPNQQSKLRSGGQPHLDTTAAQALDLALRSRAPDGGLWTAPKVAAWIAARIGQTVHETTAWRYMRRLGFTLQVPRPRHQRRATAEEQADFKKSSATP